MSNTDQRILDGMEYNNNISVNKDCNGHGGSLETEDSIFSDKILSYTINTPISLANSLFNQDGSVIITSNVHVDSCDSTTSSLTVNGGILVKKNSVINGILRICNTTPSTNISDGSLIISGGTSISQNLNVNGILSIFNTTPSTSSSGSIITLGGITINNTKNSININNGGALTVVGGASILGDLYSNLIINSIINSSNGSFLNISSSNLSVSNANFVNLTLNSLISTNSSLGNVYVNNLVNTNNSVVNLSVNYSTFGNIQVLNEITTNLTVSTLINNTGYINNFNSTQGNITFLTVGNLYVTNNIEYNDIITNLSTSNIISNFSSVGSLQVNIGTFGSLNGILGGSFLYSDSISTSNLLAISTISTNVSTANLTVQNAKITLATINNLQVTNQFINNLSSNNSIITNGTINNFYSNYAAINYLTSTKLSTDTLNIYSTSSSVSSTQAALILLYGGLSINTTSDVTSLTSGGGLTNVGGASISKSLIVGNTISSSVISSGSIYSVLNQNINILSTYSTLGQLYLTSTIASLSSTYGSLVSAGGISIFNTTDVTSLTSGGGFTDAGGASIAKSLLVGGTVSASLISSGSALLVNLSSINFTSNNSILTNSSILNLIVSSQTVNSLYVNNSSILNANFGNISTSNINSSSANILNLFSQNGSFGNLFGNYLSANYITNNISLVSQNATIATLNNSNASLGNVQIINGTFGSFQGGTLDSYTGSIGTLLSINASISNLYSINNTTLNQLSTNITTLNIISTNSNFIYTTIGSLFSSNILTNALTIGNLNVVQSSIASLNLNYETVGNSFIINLTNGNSFIQNSTIQNITNFYISSTNGSFVNISSATANITNLINTNGTFTNISSQNISTTNISSTNGTFINSTLNNTFITNSTQVNIFNSNLLSNNSTISNLYLNNGNFTNTTIVNLYSTNNTSINLLATNTTSINLVSTNQTVTTLNVLGATFGNINFTNNLYKNGLPYISSQWTSISNNIVFTTGNVGIGNVNPTSTLDVTGTGHFTQNVIIDGTVSTSNIYALNLSVGNINNAISISSQLVSSTNFFSTNSTTTNFIANSSTINSLLINQSTISNLNVTNITSKLIIINNSIPSYNSTTGTIILQNGGLSINCTVNSTSITSGGAATLSGGLSVAKDFYIGGNTYVTGSSYLTGNVWLNGLLDLNQNVINNVTAPTLNLQVANKWYVDNRFLNFTVGNVNGNFTQGQVIVATTGGNITGFNNFTFDGITLTLNSTLDATSLTNGGSLQVFGGASIDLSLFVGNNAHILGYLDMNNQKIMSVAIPTAPYDAANKYYVDNRFNQFTIGNVSGNFTQGQIIVASTGGNIIGFSNFIFDGNLLEITSTNSSLGLGSGGTLTVNGGASFLKKVYLGSGLDLNNQTIDNVTSPSLNLQVANKYYVDNRFNNFTVGNVSGNFTKGQVITAGTSGNIIGFSDFMFDGNLLEIKSTINSLGIGSGGTLNVGGGASIQGDLYLGGILNVEGNFITNVPIPINQLDAVNKEYVDFFLGIGTGDISNTSITLSNNITTFTNINLFSFTNTEVSSFVSYAYLQIPELNIYDQFELRGLLKNTTWELNTSFIGDLFNGLSFNILNTGNKGQIQYKNKNTYGNALLSFRAITTNQGSYVNITSSSLIRSVPVGGTGQPFFTQGTLLFGNGVNPINTDLNLLFDNNVLYLGNTTVSTSLTSGGVLQIAGGVNILSNVFIGNGLDVGGKNITNSTAPSLDLDVANKWYVDSKFGSSSGSLFLGGTILFSNTANSTNATTGGTLTDMGGCGIAKDLYVGGKLYVDNINMTPNLYDIFSQQTFNSLNNQSIPIDITGFNFSTTTKYFTAWLTVTILATNNLSAGFTLEGIQLNNIWHINSKFIGQNTYVNFICVNGQIKYTSSNILGFISSTIKYRALTITS